ncbi:hypothetical protein, partial [Roseiconus lacunae]|uniref:hypothetical protein n=1 Tax=Roseiconus lacunae TaxID=2605694 RepID=UPI001F23E94A
IPNTAVKLSEPMIVPTSVKVGLAIFLKALWFSNQRAFFMRAGFCCTPALPGGRGLPQAATPAQTTLQ